jgi:hypothetical protein
METLPDQTPPPCPTSDVADETRAGLLAAAASAVKLVHERLKLAAGHLLSGPGEDTLAALLQSAAMAYAAAIGADHGTVVPVRKPFEVWPVTPDAAVDRPPFAIVVSGGRLTPSALESLKVYARSYASGEDMTGKVVVFDDDCRTAESSVPFAVRVMPMLPPTATVRGIG